MDQVLTKNFSIPDAHEIEVYEKSGGYAGLRRAVHMSPERVIEEVKGVGSSGPRGSRFFLRRQVELCAAKGR